VLDVVGLSVRNVRCWGYATVTMSIPGAFSLYGLREKSLCWNRESPVQRFSRYACPLLHIIRLCHMVVTTSNRAHSVLCATNSANLWPGNHIVLVTGAQGVFASTVQQKM